jgi:hypothetical protein
MAPLDPRFCPFCNNANLKRISTHIFSPQFYAMSQAMALAGFSCENNHAFFVKIEVVTSLLTFSAPSS